MLRSLLRAAQRQQKNKVGLLFVLATLLLSFQPLGTAYADQNPSGCNSNRFNISIVKNRTEVYEGQTLTYTVTASNVDFGSDIACNITAASISVTLPAPDGTPTGTVINLVASQDFPAGTTTTIVGTADYVVHVNPGVTDIVAEASAQGVLHDAPVNHSALIVKTIGTSVVAAPSSGGGSGGPTPSTPATPALPGLPRTGSL